MIRDALYSLEFWLLWYGTTGFAVGAYQFAKRVNEKEAQVKKYVPPVTRVDPPSDTGPKGMSTTTDDYGPDDYIEGEVLDVRTGRAPEVPDWMK